LDQSIVLTGGGGKGAMVAVAVEVGGVGGTVASGALDVRVKFKETTVLD